MSNPMINDLAGKGGTLLSGDRRGWGEGFSPSAENSSACSKPWMTPNEPRVDVSERHGMAESFVNFGDLSPINGFARKLPVRFTDGNQVPRHFGRWLPFCFPLLFLQTENTADVELLTAPFCLRQNHEKSI